MRGGGGGGWCGWGGVQGVHAWRWLPQEKSKADAIQEVELLLAEHCTLGRPPTTPRPSPPHWPFSYAQPTLPTPPRLFPPCPHWLTHVPCHNPHTPQEGTKVKCRQWATLLRRPRARPRRPVRQAGGPTARAALRGGRRPAAPRPLQESWPRPPPPRAPPHPKAAGGPWTRPSTGRGSNSGSSAKSNSKNGAGSPPLLPRRRPLMPPRCKPPSRWRPRRRLPPRCVAWGPILSAAPLARAPLGASSRGCTP